jgi:hypothetical protein
MAAIESEQHEWFPRATYVDETRQAIREPRMARVREAEKLKEPMVGLSVNVYSRPVIRRIGTSMVLDFDSYRRRYRSDA